MKKRSQLSGLLRGVFAVAMVAGSILSSTAATKDVGYTSPKQDPAYMYDGYATEEAQSAYFGVKISSDMIKNYAGGRIVGFRVGWACNYLDGEIDLFVREDDFNNPDKASQHATLTYKQDWNQITLDEPYTISDNPGDIMIGYHIDLTAKDICIPFSVRGNKPAGSSYIAFEDTKDADGKLVWTDVSADFDALLLTAIVEINGDFTNRVEILDIYNNGLQVLDHTDTGIYQIANHGTNSVRSVTLQFTCGDRQAEETVNFSQAIAPDAKTKVSLPVATLGTGTTSVRITKVNGKENYYNSAFGIEVVAVPEAISESYERRTLLEYFGSENNHHNVNNFDIEIMGGLTGYTDRVSYLCHHLNDQFMTREDEDTEMLISYADGDLYKVYCPSVTIDRTVLPGNGIIRDKNVAFAVPTAMYAPTLYDAALAIPTFASLTVANAFNPEKSELNIDVTGNIAAGVLPEGENLWLTVYVLEDNVASDAQDWATPEQQQQYGGVYHHYGVIRQQPVPIWGDEIEGTGEFSKSYSVEIDTEEWKPADMRVLALIHRSGDNVRTSRQVINCAETAFDMTSIREITADGEALTFTVTPSRSITVNGSTDGVRVYTTSGALTPNQSLPAGIYVVSAHNHTTKITVR